MTKEQEVLMYLVRLGIGGDVEPDFVLDGVDWRELVELSYRQGVAAIAVDGLQKLYELCPDLELELDSPELEAVKYEWFGAVFSEEENYSKISTVAKQISDRLKAAGLRALLVKGLSYAAYYPEPKHRSFGDIDIFSPYSYAEIDDVLRPVSQNFDLEAVLKSLKKSVKHNLGEGQLDHRLGRVCQKLIVDSQASEVLQPGERTSTIHRLESTGNLVGHSSPTKDFSCSRQRVL